MEAEKVAQKTENSKAEKSSPTIASLGLTVKDLTPEQRKESGVREGGVSIEVAEELASNVGLRKGDLILRVDNTDVVDAKQFAQLLEKIEPTKQLGLLVQRGDIVQFVRIRPKVLSK